MTSRIRTIAALLIAGAALGATPVLAADAVPGNPGPAEKPANRDAPISLPGAVVAKATPKVDAATLSRDILGTDPATALANLGTVSLSRDGSVSEAPASDALRGIFEEMVKGHRT